MTPSNLLKNNIPLIDLRSAGEFAGGAFPSAVNLPLLSDEERQAVGLLYKQRGRDAAIRKGHELVSGEVKAARLRAWEDFLRRRPDAWIYCWRGGLRSEIVQSWLGEVGWRIPRVEGGYKRLRSACLEVFETLTKSADRMGGGKRWLVLAGRTGAGKTEVIKALPGALDIEALAQHRGSAFGGHEQPQPTPIAFENALAIRYLQHQAPTLVVEDESRTIGRLALPAPCFAQMRQAPIVLLEAPMEARISQILQEYVQAPLARGVGPNDLLKRHQASLARIGKRLGAERCRAVGAALQAGFRCGRHEQWIRLLLAWYYDPMYDHQLRAKRHRVVFRGGRQAVEHYLKAQCAGPLLGKGRAKRCAKLV